MCFTCSDISVSMTTRNDSALSDEARVHRLRLAVAPLGERRERRAEEQRAEHARHVELDRVERDGVRQIFLVDERRDAATDTPGRRTTARSR